MARATITAVDPKLGTVTWSHGMLTGDPHAIAAVQGMAASGTEVHLAGLGAWVAGLRDQAQALATITEALPDASVTTTGLVWDDVPPGAVA